MKRAAVYLRVSTDEQTIETQRHDVDQLARARGFQIVALYQEVASGAKKDREQLAALLDAAHRGDFEVVVVWALDRLGRSMLEVIATVQRLDQAGVDLISVRDPWMDTTGPVRSLLLAIFAWVAEWERRRLIERTRAGMERAKREGKQIGRPQAALPLAAARALLSEGLGVRAVARKLKVAGSTLRRALARNEK